ncbi:unnamed protein product [Larinioides sclopetarius]|uniref:Uncharacterized protein n=1 Tax=Larinioides sclopetarius TaxID=280406 RepID=A0AAV2ACS8_9ARAC
MEKQLNLVPKLSLNEMALRRVVVNLCYESLSDMMGKELESTGSLLFWLKKIDDVKKKISKLVLPAPLKQRMMDLVEPTCTEMQRWQSFHEDLLKDCCINFDQLYWTCTGLDYRKTAEKILRLEILEVEKRFRLACWYCLEDYITVLWAELPEKYKGRFEEEINPSSRDVVYLEYYWALILMGKEFKLHDVLPGEFVNASSTYQSYFKYSAYKGSKEGTEYFVQKLTNEERNDALYSALCYSLERTDQMYFLPGGPGQLRSDVFCYLLSLMTPEQQLQFLQQHPSNCLMSFLEWPCQDIFLDIAVVIWNFLPESGYKAMLERLFQGIFVYSRGYYLPELFQNFFMRSPINFRKQFVDRESRFSFSQLSFLVQFNIFGDEETIKVVWRNIDSDDRMKLLSYKGFFRLLLSWMSKNRYLVEMCIGEAVLSKENREMLKEEYTKFHISLQSSIPYFKDSDEVNFKQLLELLDGTCTSTNNTKCSEDETLSKTKRLASGEEKSDVTKIPKRQ